jgi:ABC-type transport system involved in multi-copper enzyme maturation permease subunit
MNPVLARETKERFRSKRTMPWLLIVWILAIGLIAYLLFIIAREIAQSQFGLGQALASGFMGRFLFESMTILVVTAVVMVVPGLTALSIIGERERQTFHLLQVTQMSPSQLVLGKLSSSIAYFAVLIVAVLPIVALPIIFGGTTFTDLAVALAFIALLTVMLGSVSMWMSARAKSSRGAVAMSYAIAFLIAFLSFAGLGAEYFFALDDRGNLPAGGVESVSAWINPYFALASAVDAPLEIGQDRFFASPYTPLELHLFARQGAGGAVDLGVGQVEPGTIRIENGRQFVNYTRPPLWVYTTIIYVLLIGLALWRATTIVTAPSTRVRARNGKKKSESPTEVVVDGAA